MVEPSIPMPSVNATSRSEGEIAMDFRVPAMSQNQSRMKRTSPSSTLRMTSSWRCSMRPVCRTGRRPASAARLPRLVGPGTPRGPGDPGLGSDVRGRVPLAVLILAHDQGEGLTVQDDGDGAVAVVLRVDHRGIEVAVLTALDLRGDHLAELL